MAGKVPNRSPVASPTNTPSGNAMGSKATVHCASCRGALQTVRRLELAGLVLFALSLAVAALLPEALRLPLGLPLVLLGLSGLGSAAALRWRGEPWFRGRPYDHTRR